MNFGVQALAGPVAQARIHREDAQNQMWTSIRSNSSQGIIQAILNGANVEALDRNGLTPLAFAVKEGFDEAVKALVFRGAIIDRKVGRDEKTALHWAAIKGRNPTVVFLLKVGADVGMKNNRGWTPLHFSSCEGHTSTTKLLIDYGADIGATDWRLRTPLHCAAEWGHLENAKLLVEAGADISAKNNEGATPMEIATIFEHTSVVSYLSSLAESK